MSALRGVVLPGPRGGLPGPRGGGTPACIEAEPPPVNRMTNRCKNITLATTSLRPVINDKVSHRSKYQTAKNCPLFALHINLKFVVCVINK